MGKTKGFLKEFKEFAMKGNVIDLAVGVIIGGAFQKIVSSLVSDIVMPLIGLITGGLSFADKFFVFGLKDGETYATVDAAIAAGKNVLTYGKFLDAVINFLIMAFVIFIFIKCINKLKSAAHKEVPAEPAAPTTKICPFCKSEIDIGATRCPHCTSEIAEQIAE